jgi:hypothetical protein
VAFLSAFHPKMGIADFARHRTINSIIIKVDNKNADANGHSYFYQLDYAERLWW